MIEEKKAFLSIDLDPYINFSSSQKYLLNSKNIKKYDEKKDYSSKGSNPKSIPALVNISSNKLLLRNFYYSYDSDKRNRILDKRSAFLNSEKKLIKNVISSKETKDPTSIQKLNKEIQYRHIPDLCYESKKRLSNQSESPIKQCKTSGKVLPKALFKPEIKSRPKISVYLPLHLKNFSNLTKNFDREAKKKIQTNFKSEIVLKKKNSNLIQNKISRNLKTFNSSKTVVQKRNTSKKVPENRIKDNRIAETKILEIKRRLKNNQNDVEKNVSVGSSYSKNLTQETKKIPQVIKRQNSEIMLLKKFKKVQFKKDKLSKFGNSLRMVKFSVIEKSPVLSFETPDGKITKETPLGHNTIEQHIIDPIKTSKSIGTDIIFDVSQANSVQLDNEKKTYPSRSFVTNFSIYKKPEILIENSTKNFSNLKKSQQSDLNDISLILDLKNVDYQSNQFDFLDQTMFANNSNLKLSIEYNCIESNNLDYNHEIDYNLNDTNEIDFDSEIESSDKLSIESFYNLENDFESLRLNCLEYDCDISLLESNNLSDYQEDKVETSVEIEFKKDDNYFSLENFDSLNDMASNSVNLLIEESVATYQPKTVISILSIKTTYSQSFIKDDVDHFSCNQIQDETFETQYSNVPIPELDTVNTEKPFKTKSLLTINDNKLPVKRTQSLNLNLEGVYLNPEELNDIQFKEGVQCLKSSSQLFIKSSSVNMEHFFAFISQPNKSMPESEEALIGNTKNGTTIMPDLKYENNFAKGKQSKTHRFILKFAKKFRIKKSKVSTKDLFKSETNFNVASNLDEKKCELLNSNSSNVNLEKIQVQDFDQKRLSFKKEIKQNLKNSNKIDVESNMDDKSKQIGFISFETSIKNFGLSNKRKNSCKGSINSMEDCDPGAETDDKMKQGFKFKFGKFKNYLRRKSSTKKDSNEIFQEFNNHNKIDKDQPVEVSFETEYRNKTPILNEIKPSDNNEAEKILKNEFFNGFKIIDENSSQEDIENSQRNDIGLVHQSRISLHVDRNLNKLNENCTNKSKVI